VTLLDFGQPLGAVFQFAYTVEDLDRAMNGYTARLGAGPWFVRGPFTPPEARYRGEPSRATFSLARAFAGHVMVELIQQHDDARSVFHEGEGARRYGFHHWGIMTGTIDGDLERLSALGHEEAFSDRLPSGARVVYLDARPDLPGMIELVEHTEAQEQVYTQMYRASVGWDGGDPQRRSER
jgi:hypothetical protein